NKTHSATRTQSFATEVGFFAGATVPSARRIFRTLCLVLVVLACGLSDAAYARIGEEHNKSEDRDKTIPHWTTLQHGDIITWSRLRCVAASSRTGAPPGAPPRNPQSGYLIANLRLAKSSSIRKGLDVLAIRRLIGHSKERLRSTFTATCRWRRRSSR